MDTPLPDRKRKKNDLDEKKLMQLCADNLQQSSNAVNISPEDKFGAHVAERLKTFSESGKNIAYFCIEQVLFETFMNENQPMMTSPDFSPMVQAQNMTTPVNFS